MATLIWLYSIITKLGLKNETDKYIKALIRESRLNTFSPAKLKLKRGENTSWAKSSICISGYLTLFYAVQVIATSKIARLK